MFMVVLSAACADEIRTERRSQKADAINDDQGTQRTLDMGESPATLHDQGRHIVQHRRRTPTL